MRIAVKAVVALVAAVLVAGQTAAQDSPSARGFVGGSLGLVQNAGVQKELKLTEEQIEKAKTATREVFGKFKDDFGKLKEATPEQRAELGKKFSDEAHKVLADVLKPEQLKRLKEIERQQRGLTDLDSQQALKLSDEQKAKVKKITEEHTEKVREARKSFRDNPKEAIEKINALNKAAREKEANLLTDDQKKQWKELTGESFEVKFDPQARPKQDK